MGTAKNNSDEAVAGKNDRLKSNENLGKPSIGESRMEGIEPGTTKQPREGTEFEEAYPSVKGSPTDKAVKSTTEQPLKVTNFIQPREDEKESGNISEDHTDANKLKQFTETLANEDEVNKVIEKYDRSIVGGAINETSEKPLENLERTSDISVTETTSGMDSSIGDGMYDNLDDLNDPSDVEIKDEQDNILEVFDENKANEEDEGYEPKHLASPDDEFSQKDVL